MRPIKLELENFGVYRGRHEIDFSPLSFFVIKGKTGSGKSTLIDALCYALFGAVPRYGGEKAHRHLISKGQKSMRVALDFSVRGKNYRIEREYRVEKDKGRSDFRFYEGGRAKPLREEELRNYIKDLLKLDYRAFIKVLLLPQNQFDRFLKPEDQRERRDILNSLLGFSGLFSSMKELIREEYSILQNKVELLQSRLSQLQKVTPHQIAVAEESLKALQSQYEELLQKRTGVQQTLQRCKDRDSLLLELSKLQQSLQELASKNQEMQQLRKRLELAIELLPYLPRLEEYQSIKEQEQKYSRERLHKELELKKYSEERQQVEEELKKLEEEFNKIGEYNGEILRLNQTLQLLNSHRQVEKEAQEIQKELRRAEESLRQERSLEENTRQRFLEDFQLLRELQERIQACQWAEERIGEAEKLEDQLRRLQEGLERERRLAEELKEAERALQAQREDSEKALRAYEELTERIQELRKEAEELRKALQEKEEFLRREIKLQELLLKAQEQEELLLQKRELQKEREELSQTLRTLQEELKELEGKKIEFYAAQIRSSLEPGSTCPVCGGVIGQEHHPEVAEDLSSLSERLAQLMERKEALARELSAKDTRISLIEDRIHELVNTLQGVQKADIEREFLHLQERLRELAEKESLLSKVQKELDQLMARQRELFEKLQQIQSKEAELRSSLSSKATLLKDLQTEIEGLRRALGKDPVQAHEEIESIKKSYQELRKYRDQERTYLQKLEELQRELSESQKRLASLEERRRGLELQLEDRKSKLEELQREITLLTGEPFSPYLEENTKRRVQELSQRINQVQEKYARCNKYLQEIRAKEANLLSDLQNIDKFIQKLQERKNTIAGELYHIQKKFQDPQEVKGYLLNQEQIRALQQQLEAYERELHTLEKGAQELQRALTELHELPQTQQVEKELQQIEGALHQNREAYGTLREALESLKKELEEKESIESQLKGLKAQLDLYGRLRSDFTDNQFPEFVSQLMLRKVAERANYYLFKFTSGQFTFDTAEGDLQVLDHSTGHHRVVSSLSGGETFLASLSLAFAVADILSHNAPLESLFIDEGFGSLDRETRESLSEFFDLVKESANRMVGIITHVEDVAERFSQRIEVEKKGGCATLKVIY